MTSARCTVCGADSLQMWWSDGSRRVYRCRVCDMRFLHPRPESSTLAEIYGDAYFRDHYLAHAPLRLAYFQDRLRALERRTLGRRVIDVGCGPGLFLRAATESGWQTAGVDISDAAVRYAQAGGYAAVRGELGSFVPPFAPDVVTMWDVIAHVPDPPAFARAAAALLRPGGLLVMKFPYRRRGMYRAAQWLSPVLPTAGLLSLTAQPHHFTPRSASCLMQLAGCRVLDLERVDEIALPVAASDSLRLRAAKLATAAATATGAYQSLIVYAERLAA